MYVRCGNGGGGNSLKDVYRNIVITNPNGYTSYSLSPYSSRCTISEGGVVDDTTNHTIYVYADYTVNSNQPTSSAFTMITVPNMGAEKMPYVYVSSSPVRGYATMTTDESSTQPTKSMCVNYVSSAVSIVRASGQGANANDHYIIYGSWKY